MHAALWLVMVLAGAAAQYLLLAAEFVAVTQVLVYVGAVMVLFLFGVMLTRAKLGAEADLNNKNYWHAAPVALADARRDGVRAARRLRGHQAADRAGAGVDGALSDDIFGPYLLPFWALSFVLLAAVIGAIVLARKD